MSPSIGRLANLTPRSHVMVFSKAEPDTKQLTAISPGVEDDNKNSSLADLPVSLDSIGLIFGGRICGLQTPSLPSKHLPSRRLQQNNVCYECIALPLLGCACLC